MHEIALDLLILLGGVLLGPAVFGWIQPGELIQLLAEIGIFFLMFHAGVETQPLEFFQALKRSLGVGMCGRAEIAFILAALALAQGAIDKPTFSALIFTAFILNLFTPLALKGCATLLQGKAIPQKDALSGLVQIDSFGAPLVDERYDGKLRHELPDVEDAVVIYGYGPEVATLMEELDGRGITTLVIEADESVARRLQARGVRVIQASIAEGDLDLRPLVEARALVANGDDEYNATLALSARELGFEGPIVALIDNPNRRAPLQLAGATAAFTATHVLAAAVAVERAGEVIMDFPATFSLAEDDDIYLCGTVESLNRFYDSYQQDDPPLTPVTT